MMHMHFAPSERRLIARIPICGYMNDADELCSDVALVTCPECRDWVMLETDAQTDSQSDGEVES